MDRHRGVGTAASSAAVAIATLLSIVVAACTQSPPPSTESTPRAAAAAVTGASLVPTRLRVEALESPLAIATPRPRFSWIDTAASADAHGLRQSAYQVLVASSPDALARERGDRWDSGRVESDATFGVAYAGPALRSREPLFWTVRVWDGEGRPSGYAPPARFAMGLLEPSDWKAEWIGYDADRDAAPPEIDLAPANWIAFPQEAPQSTAVGLFLYHAQLTLPADRTIQRAELLATADNRLSVVLNGAEVVHEKGTWQNVANVDVARNVRAGANDLRVLVKNEFVGWSGLILKLEVWTDDGAKHEFVSDASWRATDQPGEQWDRRALSSEKWPAVKVLGGYGVEPWKKVTRPELFLPPTALLRTRFKVGKPVARATVYATALGLIDVHVNGARVSDERFTPGWTDYSKRVYYRAFDVTGRVKSGENILGAELADGWYCGYVGWGRQRNHYGKRPRARVQLCIDYADGASEIVASDRRWEARSGATREADFLMGEWLDAEAARRAATAGWSPVVVGAEIDPKIEPHPGPAVQTFAELEPVKITEPRNGVWVFDLGQNFAGVARLKVRGAPGQKIELRFAERLDPDGMLYTTNLRGARTIDRFTCAGAGAGDGEEVFEPRFTFHGFQYVEVTGLTQAPTKQTITGIAFSSATPPAGSFRCSNPMLERLQRNSLWTQRANYIDVPTDCPQRDERLGWTGDAQAYIRAATYLTDVQAFFTKWLVDLDDAQRADGQFPMVAPLKVAGGDGGPAWADAGVICPWTIWQVYADRRLLESHYPAMKRFVEFCRARATPELLPPEKFHCFGDWLQVECETPTTVIFEAYFALAARIVADAAGVLGQSADQKKYDELHRAVKAAFVRAYVQPDGTVKGDTQCAYVLALMADLLDGELKQKAAQRLVADIERRKNHLSTGFVGTKDLMLVLSRIGRSDVAWRLIENTTYPSWGFTIEHGATSIWERWNGWTPERGFEDPGMNSFAHYAFGAVYQWMAETLGGIQSDAPGFARIRIAPEPGGSVTWANVEYDSIRGPIGSSWRLDGERFLLEVTIPPNTTARVVVPAADPTTITVNGLDPARAGVRGSPAATPGRFELEVGSGRWSFVSKPSSNRSSER